MTTSRPRSRTLRWIARVRRALKAPRGTSSLVSRAGLPAVDLLGLPRSRDLFAIAVEKCLEHQPGSREWLFDTINDWYAAGDSGAFVLLAGAGVGKSVAMAELARRGCSALWACDWVASASRSSRLAPSVVTHFFAAPTRWSARWRRPCSRWRCSSRQSRQGLCCLMLVSCAM